MKSRPHERIVLRYYKGDHRGVNAYHKGLELRVHERTMTRVTLRLAVQCSRKEHYKGGHKAYSLRFMRVTIMRGVL